MKRLGVIILNISVYMGYIATYFFNIGNISISKEYLSPPAKMKESDIKKYISICVALYSQSFLMSKNSDVNVSWRKRNRVSCSEIWNLKTCKLLKQARRRKATKAVVVAEEEGEEEDELEEEEKREVKEGEEEEQLSSAP